MPHIVNCLQKFVYPHLKSESIFIGRYAYIKVKIYLVLLFAHIYSGSKTKPSLLDCSMTSSIFLYAFIIFFPEEYCSSLHKSMFSCLYSEQMYADKTIPCVIVENLGST